MARLLGVDLPRNKKMSIALRSLYGVGPKVATDVLAKVGISGDKSSNEITEEEVQAIRTALEEYTVEGDLRREIALNIKRLKDLGCYRGIRHRKGLPVNVGFDIVEVYLFVVSVLIQTLVRVRVLL